MNKKSLILTVALAAGIATLNAQNVNIPDANFKAYLLSLSAVNTNMDLEIQVSEAATYTGGINPVGLGINDLTGIEAFTSITSLECHLNNLTSLNLSNNTMLTQLACSFNQLTSLDLSNNTALTNVICIYNQLTSINISNNPVLNDLRVYENLLTSINVSNCPLLQIFDCSSNPLTNLDLATNLELVSVFCYSNPQLTTLDLSHNNSLTEFGCSGSNLSSLNLANGNNSAFTFIQADNNPNLSCIQVDNALYSTNNWTGSNFQFDVNASFSENCAETTFVNEITSTKSQIAVYPNPTKNHINFSVKTNVQLTSVIGQFITVRENVNTLDLSDLPAGIYVLTFIDNKEQVVQRSKIVKE